MTPAALADLRARLPGCELAVFADFGSGTVLAADGAFRFPQEYLDALCTCAAQLFSDEDAPLDHVMFLGATGARAFFRSEDTPNEALCCICAPDADVPAMLEGIRSAIGSNGAGGE